MERKVLSSSAKVGIELFSLSRLFLVIAQRAERYPERMSTVRTAILCSGSGRSFTGTAILTVRKGDLPLRPYLVEYFSLRKKEKQLSSQYVILFWKSHNISERYYFCTRKHIGVEGTGTFPV